MYADARLRFDASPMLLHDMLDFVFSLLRPLSSIFLRRVLDGSMALVKPELRHTRHRWVQEAGFGVRRKPFFSSTLRLGTIPSAK
jgi:hypothetical protein